MNDLLELFTSQEMIVVYIVAAVASLLCIMIYFVEKNNLKARRRHNTRELNKLVKEVKEQTEEEAIDEGNYYEEPILVSSIEEEQKEESSVVEMIGEVEQLEAEPSIPEIPVVETALQEHQEQMSFDTFYDEADTLEDVFEDIEPVEEKIEVPKVEEELQYTDVEPDVQTAQMELRQLAEELQKQAEEKKVENIKLTSYEEEQEENAIISLEELVQKSKSLYEANEATQYTDEGNEPISLQELQDYSGGAHVVDTSIYDEPFLIENAVSHEEMVSEPVQEEVKKFKSSPIISPIFGIEKEPSNELELENTANYQKLDEEIRKTNEFLMTLKELQQRLDR